MASLVPIKGKPGLFFDRVTGRVLNIVEWREDDKYDTVGQVLGAIAAGTELVLFRDINGKDLIDINLKQPRRIAAGEEMRVEKIGVYIPLAFGNVIVAPVDVKRFAENAHASFQINGKDISEGPVIKYGSGYGLAGMTQETGAGVLSIGVPSTAASAKLARDHELTSNHEIDCSIKFFRRRWAIVTGGSSIITDANEMPTLGTAIFAKVFLRGLIKSAATKG